MKKYLAAIALPLAACSPANDAEPSTENTAAPAESAAAAVPDVKLYAFDCGRITMLDLSIFSSKGEYEQGREHNAADMCFLVRHPEGDLMWDAGLPDAFNAEEDGVTNGPFQLSVPTTLASQLEMVGVAPDEIEYFSISHSHFDHVGNAAMFAGSTLLIDKDERAHMFRDEAREAETFGLVAPLEEAETIEFDGDYDVFGDGSVTIIATPGHTPGHTSLLVNLNSEDSVLLTGDLYHLLESREKRIQPTFNTDKEETLRSMDRFEALAEETGAKVIIQHSLEHMAELPAEMKAGG